MNKDNNDEKIHRARAGGDAPRIDSGPKKRYNNNKSLNIPAF